MESFIKVIRFAFGWLVIPTSRSLSVVVERKMVILLDGMFVVVLQVESFGDIPFFAIEGLFLGLDKVFLTDFHSTLSKSQQSRFSAYCLLILQNW